MTKKENDFTLTSKNQSCNARSIYFLSTFVIAVACITMLKKYHLYFFPFLILFFPFKISCQNSAYKSSRIKIKKTGEINLSSYKGNEWMPSLQNMEMPKPGGEGANEELARIKKRLSERYPSKKTYKTNRKNSPGSATPSPLVQTNFEGNLIGGTVPNDNDIAISNEGMIVSVINTVINVYNADSLSTPIWKKSLEGFATVNPDVPKNNASNSNGKFDPKVIYDPEADRFIIVMLNGFDTVYSRIIVAFSQTNNPKLGWNIYVLPGDPLNNGLWTDYPQIAMTKEDFFITVNLLSTASYPGPKPWEKQFTDDVVWQMKKQDGYNGSDSVSAALYHDIEYNGKILQYMTLVKGGDSLQGPNMYLISNRAFTEGNDSIFLIEVTNSLSSGTASVKVRPGTGVQYYVPPNARQPHNYDSLLTNDGRVLGSFLKNGQIQFVFPTLDTTTGFSAIYHGIIKNITDTGFILTSKIIGHHELDFGFPNISYAGYQVNYSGINIPENEAIITFDHSSFSSFPGISAVFYNSDATYSDVIEVKKGDTAISAINGLERWGDYSGSQRKYNEPGKIWVVGTFGSKGTTGKSRKYGTWIAELANPNTPVKPENPSQLAVFPNPSNDIFSLNFTLAADDQLNIAITDMKGSVVKQWTEENAKAGQNIFSFSTVPLSPGVYIVSIESQGKLILKEKLIKN